MEFLFQFLSDIFSTSNDEIEVQPVGHHALEINSANEMLLDQDDYEEHNIFSLCEFH